MKPSRNFILVAFSETVREVSYTRNGEFKLYRMPAQKLEGFKPDIFGIFSKKLSRNRNGLAAFLENRKSVEVSVSDANTVQGELPLPRPLGGYDVVITSPPYGDSQTTVAYGQYSRLAAEWIGLPNCSQNRQTHKWVDSIQKETLADSPISPAVDKSV